MLYLHFNTRENHSWNVTEYLQNVLVDVKEDQEINLDLSFAGINKRNFEQVFPLLERRKIVFLNMAGNRFGDDGARAVSLLCQRNRYIERVGLQYNQIGDRGARLCTVAIDANPKLKIELAHNHIEARGGADFVEQVTKSRATEIDLSNNRLKNDGAIAIAEVLSRRVGNLTSLRLTHNDIGFAGDKALAENVPSGVQILHRVKYVRFTEAHPIIAIFLMIICPLLICILPFIRNEKDVPGCEYTLPPLAGRGVSVMGRP